MTTAEKLLPRDTRVALQSLAVKDCSRSLYFDRYSRPDLDKDPRKQFFTDGFGAHRSSIQAKNWAAAMRLDPAQLIFAQLQSRLMVNMAGGVMVNAGLCLDRFGLPYIPGSAVKGCARRAALATLHEWCETGSKPADKEHEKNLFTAACASFNSPTEILAAIAHVFGWSEQDWSQKKNDGRFVSDFAWACGDKQEEIWKKTAEQLASQLHVAIRDEHKETPWKSLPNFAGSISFLPAYPVDLGKTGKVDGLPVEIPLLGKLELDIVTCHHGDYYASKDPDKKATDTEEPVPVVFPAVAVGHVFAFALLALRGCDKELLTHARAWLTTGLQTFGLGAKTAAGYGWFETKPAIGEAVLCYLRDSAEAHRKGREAQAEKERQDQADAVRRKAREELNKATANMNEDESLLYTLTVLQEPQFLSKLDRWKDLTPGERVAIYQLMRTAKSSLWLDLRKKAAEGKQKEKTRWGLFVGDIFKMAKDRKEKMPS